LQVAAPVVDRNSSSNSATTTPHHTGKAVHAGEGEAKMQAYQQFHNPIKTQTLYTGKHAYSLSQRVSIRWPPEEAYENTDTTVLSVNNFFVDLRVEKQTRKLDWAIAGVRLVDPTDPSMFFFALLFPLLTFPSLSLPFHC
jgi:Protein HRI1